jgi:hypothetical protein
MTILLGIVITLGVAWLLHGLWREARAQQQEDALRAWRQRLAQKQLANRRARHE